MLILEYQQIKSVLIARLYPLNQKLIAGAVTHGRPAPDCLQTPG